MSNTPKKPGPAEDWEQHLREPVPAPRANAREAAMAAAMAAFNETHQPADDAVPEKKIKSRQGFFQWWRPTGKPNQEKVNPVEKINLFQRNKWMMTGMASASVAVVALLAIQQQPAPVNDAKTPALPAEMAEGRSTPERRDVDEPEADMAQAPLESVEESVARPAVLADETRLAKASKAERAKADAERQQLMGTVAQEKKREMVAARLAMPAAPAAASMMMPSEPVPQPAYQERGRDDFETVEDNPVKQVTADPVSTFSIDVDTASYSFVRRQLNQGVLPQKDAVRVEEMINYFDYQYPAPTDTSVPFTTNVMVTDSPWATGNKLMHIGIKGYEIQQKPKSNLVFLLDVSGSMNAPDKLPLVKQSMALLLSQLNPDDTVAIAVYAGAAGTVLAPTPAREKHTILQALNQLQAGGSTAGAEGIKLAYQLAGQHFDKQAVNRVLLATDGDFNVGITDRDELKGFVEREREKGIYLSVLGFGQGNYHDHLMQELAQNGNGVAAYIDTLSEAQKVLVTEATSALFPIAQDVKIQVEFNPASVAEYRLIGYETRALKREDFNNDKVDAGDIGAGHTVTAIYELTPVGGKTLIDASRYGTPQDDAGNAAEYAFVKLRYKLPGETRSRLIEQPVAARNTANERTRVDTGLMREVEFATAVAGFAQLLRGGKYTGSWSYDDAIALAQANKGEDLYGYRTEFVQLVRKAKMAKAL
ncbi:vWA domain-containing protein [Simiduia agarivorans]|uniref:Arginine biosynthesis bifunctional glutamate N-acetyltransferase/amino-acid acetyltransferase n=1 Tax=Simiduia agarivorans (strain DSM 21679 / JCM 13881 / BCRC 17597 / SA1) TaxID=1117647 RepID=K4KJG1_SIMAS|nr:VWA domain-containing protein [Simiduia agarivorans]AFU99274.1 arginine biosynthesis bifunctional glutamate N-acetyltransferase/amino-acid acetyltransferase [Simiduia agarivorans SA1 = DSM 21679]